MKAGDIYKCSYCNCNCIVTLDSTWGNEKLMYFYVHFGNYKGTHCIRTSLCKLRKATAEELLLI